MIEERSRFDPSLMKLRENTGEKLNAGDFSMDA
jgi:hypothetical protein